MDKKYGRTWLTGLGMALLLGMNVMAADDIKVVGNYTGEEEVSLYIKGIGEEVSSLECQIGTKGEQQIQYEEAQKMEIAAKTLIMVDNSLSITKENREKISSLLLEFVDDKPENEQVSIVTFSEGVTKVTEFITEQEELENAIQTLTYQDQETYLTDVLYDVVENNYLGEEDCYKRIIIISDGVDNKSLGYTKDELYTLIKEKSYPIYTIGCVYKKNDEQLKNMFALARMTAGKDYLLDEIENTDDIVDSITVDNQVMHIRIKPEDTLMDGGRKSVLLTIGTADGEQKKEMEITMPFKAEEKETEVIVQEPKEEAPAEENISAEEEKNSAIGWYIAGIAAFIIVCGAGLLIFIIKRNKSKKKKDFEVLSESVDFKTEYASQDNEGTVLLKEEEQDGSTQLIWGDREKKYTLILTDLKNQGRSFQIPLNGAVIIGRKSSEANIVIDYEKSVSGKHCQISERGGKFYVKDLQSSNGTLLNGTRILTEMEIHSGCTLTLGRVDMKVEIR